MAPAVLLFLSTFLLFTAQPLVAEYQVSQISDGQVQVGPATTLAPIEATSTTSETSTASVIFSVTALNNTAAVAAPSSTTGSMLPTSILLAAPAGAPGAASNYTGLETLAGETFPTPHVPIPVGGTSTPLLGGLNGTGSAATNGPTGMTTLAPTGTSGGEESPSSTSTEGPLAATGAAVRISHIGGWKEMAAAGAVAWLVGRL